MRILIYPYVLRVVFNIVKGGILKLRVETKIFDGSVTDHEAIVDRLVKDLKTKFTSVETMQMKICIHCLDFASRNGCVAIFKKDRVILDFTR